MKLLQEIKKCNIGLTKVPNKNIKKFIKENNIENKTIIDIIKYYEDSINSTPSEISTVRGGI